MNVQKFSARAFLMLAGTLVTLSGCAGPKVISAMTSRNDRIKFVYFQNRFFGGQQGLIECKTGQDGTLSE
ncbi:MAG: hypothetical protein ACK4N5_18625, partial [Myxococcales bacterium]